MLHYHTKAIPLTFSTIGSLSTFAAVRTYVPLMTDTFALLAFTVTTTAIWTICRTGTCVEHRPTIKMINPTP